MRPAFDHRIIGTDDLTLSIAPHPVNALVSVPSSPGPPAAVRRRSAATRPGPTRRSGAGRVGPGLTILASAMAACYFLQVSLLARVVPGNLLYFGMYALLLIAGGASIMDGRPRLTNFWALAFVAVSGISSFASRYPTQSLAKWAGLAIVILVVGPVMISRTSIALREVAWRTSLLLVLAIGLASAAWYVLRLPVLGGGAFTGVMSHSMLVGPISGLAVTLCLIRAISGRSRLWLFLGLACVLPCLASGSRMAVAASALAVAWTILASSLAGASTRRRLLASAGACALVLMAVLLGASPLATEEVTQALADKGTADTRSTLWEARLEEFAASPLIGQGIGVGEGEGFEEYGGSIKIEPGSGYLAVLSMTGLAGTVSMASMLFLVLGSLLAVGNPTQRHGFIELSAVGVYLAGHAFAEGWILAVGSPFCFLAWLCIGHANDWAAVHFRQAATGNRVRRLSGSAKVF